MEAHEVTRLMEAAQAIPAILAFGFVALAAGLAALLYAARSR